MFATVREHLCTLAADGSLFDWKLGPLDVELLCRYTLDDAGDRMLTPSRFALQSGSPDVLAIAFESAMNLDQTILKLIGTCVRKWACPINHRCSWRSAAHY